MSPSPAHGDANSSDLDVAPRVLEQARGAIECALSASRRNAQHVCVEALLVAQARLFRSLALCRERQPIRVVVHFCAWSFSPAQVQRLADGSAQSERQLKVVCDALAQLDRFPRVDDEVVRPIFGQLESAGCRIDSPVAEAFIDGYVASLTARCDGISNSAEQSRNFT